MKRFVSLILSVCFLFSINTVSYAANISSRKASNPVIQSMNDKYHVDFSGMSIDELNKFIDKMKDEDQTRASGNLLNNTQYPSAIRFCRPVPCPQPAAKPRPDW